VRPEFYPGRSSAAQAKVVEIVNEAKKTGVVRRALEQTGAKGVRATALKRTLTIAALIALNP